MTVSQANTIPITNKGALETVTLKNIVALDLVEKNEAFLKVLGLFDDSKTKLRLDGDSWDNEKLKELIQSKSSELSILEGEIASLKELLNDPNSDANKDSQLIKLLSSDFLKDDVPVDDTADLIEKFEKENGVKVIISETNSNYHKVDGSYLPEAPKPVVKDSDNDVVIE